MSGILKREGKVIPVDVAKGGSFFDPDTIVADIGDVISFRFYPTNHTVVRAAYKAPCVPYETYNPGQHGYFSGFHPLANAVANPPTWNLTVNDTLADFFYCTAPDSCIGNQMVGVINPNSSVSLNVQKELAKDSKFMLIPGQPIPAEGASPTSTPTTTSSAAPSGQGSGLSPGAIAGIVIGGLALIGAVVLGRYLLMRHFLAQRRKSGWGRVSTGPPRPPPQGPDMNDPFYSRQMSGATYPTDNFNPAYAGSSYPQSHGSMSPQHFPVSPPASPPPQFPVEAPSQSDHADANLLKPMGLQYQGAHHPAGSYVQELEGSDKAL